MGTSADNSTAVAACADRAGPAQIDAVIVNSTSWNPVPSLAACVINHFQMRHTTLAYTLSGMGCAASVIAIDLAKELLQVSSGAWHSLA